MFKNATQKIRDFKDGDAKYWFAAVAITAPVVLTAGQLIHAYLPEEDKKKN